MLNLKKKQMKCIYLYCYKVTWSDKLLYYCWTFSLDLWVLPWLSLHQCSRSLNFNCVIDTYRTGPRCLLLLYQKLSCLWDPWAIIKECLRGLLVQGAAIANEIRRLLIYWVFFQNGYNIEYYETIFCAVANVVFISNNFIF